MQTQTDIYANSVEPDETAHKDPYYEDIHFLPLFFFVCVCVFLLFFCMYVYFVVICFVLFLCCCFVSFTFCCLLFSYFVLTKLSFVT